MVVGFYHHKAATPLDPAQVKGAAEEFGFRFPVAVDAEWKTLKRWWLATGDRRWTSVSFLLDRRGVVRFVHPRRPVRQGRPGLRRAQGEGRGVAAGGVTGAARPVRAPSAGGCTPLSDSQPRRPAPSACAGG